MSGDRELERILGEALGAEVALLARRPGAYASSYELEELDVLVDGVPQALVRKNVGESGLSAEAGRVKPLFLRDSLREPWAYEHVLAERVPDAPRLYAAIDDPEHERRWLFLERIAGTPLPELAGVGIWEEAGRWLARLHAGGAPSPGGPLLRYDRALYDVWLGRALEFNPAGDVAWLELAHPVAADRLLTLAPTFLHGEFYGSNVLVEDGARIRPVDWEMAAVGPGVLDLAALTVGVWSSAERDAIVRAYYGELVGDPAGRPDESFAEELECARLHVAVQWLGWSAGWTPPPEHQHLWLAEAVTAAERLGL